MKVARFPTFKDLAGFDFGQSNVNESMVRQLHGGEFMEKAHNVVMVGGPGTGKTHLATAIGVQAIQHHRCRVRFLPAIELVNSLELEKAAGKQGQLAYRLMHTDLVILDELGYLPFSQTGGALLFHFISKLSVRSILHRNARGRYLPGLYNASAPTCRLWDREPGRDKILQWSY